MTRKITIFVLEILVSYLFFFTFSTAVDNAMDEDMETESITPERLVYLPSIMLSF